MRSNEICIKVHGPISKRVPFPIKMVWKNDKLYHHLFEISPRNTIFGRSEWGRRHCNWKRHINFWSL